MAGTHFEHDAEFLRDFHRSELHHLGTRSGELQHLVVDNLGFRASGTIRGSDV